MTLIDTSAWVEYLRGTGSDAHRAVKRLLEGDALVHTTDVVVMEVLAGARDHVHEQQLRRLLGRCDHLPGGGPGELRGRSGPLPDLPPVR